jgi:phosphoribosylglycinamide formyltransferase 1
MAALKGGPRKDRTAPGSGDPLKVGVLISGRGSNLKALIDACRDETMPAQIVTVISNNTDAAGLARAKEAGIPTQVVNHREFSDRTAFDTALDAALRDAGANFVCLAGFMRLLTRAFVAAWHDRMINIHPSLLPAFPGLDTHARALAAGVKLTGCSVHFVRFETDTGPIVVQAAVPVLSSDTAESLAERVLAAEHRAYPLALRLVAEGRVRIVDGQALIEGPLPAPGCMLNPPGA